MHSGNAGVACDPDCPQRHFGRQKFTALADDISSVKDDISGVKGEIADLSTSMPDEFDHVDTQFAATND
jgi:hypothetical protein